MKPRKEDPLVRFEKFLKGLSRQEVAGLMYEYFMESNHQSWDGHPRRDVSAYRNLVEDIMACHEAATRDDKEYFLKPISTGLDSGF